MSLVVRKPAFCIWENKDAGHLADQHLCFRYTDSTIPLLSILNPKFQASSHFCDCTAWFVSDLVENPKDRFSHNEAQIVCIMHHLGSACNDAQTAWTRSMI